MIYLLIVYVVALVVLQIMLPWWSLAIIAFIAGWLIQGTVKSSGWTGTHWGRALILAVISGSAWLVPAIWLHSVRDSVLTERMGEMLGVGQVSLVFVITFAIAFAVAFLAALAGSLVTASRSH